MPKQPDLLTRDAPTLTYSFYRPHKRVQFTGEVLDLKTGELVKLPSMTKQSFKDECDINNILKQYKQTGIVSHINERAAQGMYADLPDPTDFQESLNIVQDAQTAFASLPSKVRTRFNNNPAQFLEFCADPRNAKEMAELGLTTPAQIPSSPEAPPQKPPGELTPPGPKLSKPDA